MLRTFLLSISICFAMAIGNSAVSPIAKHNNLESQDTVSTVISDNEEIAVIEQVEETGSQVEISSEVSGSKTMTKHEKADNLKKNDEHGFALTVIAMVILLCALAILYLLFLGFGKISSHLQAKKKLAAQGKTKKDFPMEKQDLDSGEVIAAISLALAQHFDAHDIEDNVLTMKRMKRAYSPWNSKIYNMREVPMLRKNFK